MPHRSPEELAAALERAEAALVTQEAASTAQAAELARLRSSVHHVAGNQQARIAVESLAAKRADIPFWAKAAIAGLAIIVPSLTIASFANSFINTRTEEGVRTAATVSRLSAVEVRLTDMATLSTRVQALENRSANLQQNRDQQYQGLADRLRGLEASDQLGVQQVQTLANTIAGLVARVEEIQRRQMEFERQLRGRSMGDEDTVPPRPLYFVPTS